MFEPTTGQYYDTIQTENIARINRVIDRLDKVSHTYTILNDNSIVVICQTDHDASIIIGAMIESGCSFEYRYTRFGGTSCSSGE